MSKDKHAKKKTFPIGRTLFLTVLVCLAATSVVLAMHSETVVDYLQKQGEVPVYAGAADSLRSEAPAPTSQPPTGTTAVSKLTAPPSTAAPTRPARTTVLQSTARADAAYLDDTVFVGDSRVNGMLYAGVIKQKNTYAYNGLSHSAAMTKKFVNIGTGKELTVAEALGVRKPKRAIVAFGINGIAWIGESSFIQGYEELLDAMIQKSPDTTFIIQSILPVSAGKEQEDSRYANAKIDRYNQRLEKLAEKKGLYYLNAAEALKNDKGALEARYSRDGLHFTDAASKAIIDYVLTHTVE